MTDYQRARLAFHGAIVLLVGLLCGYATVPETVAGAERLWHTAHEALIMIGVWTLATAALFPSLTLGKREQLGLVWSSLATGYGLMVGVITNAIIGVQVFEPVASAPVTYVSFTGTAVGILGSMLTAILTIQGARASMKAARTG